MTQCEKCGADCSELLGHVTLRAGFVTTLCDQCRNEWTEAFRASELCADLGKIDACEDSYKCGATGGETIHLEAWEALYADGEAVNRRVFAFARRWMAAPAPTRTRDD